MANNSSPSKRITAADVARSLGVSRATVGFVLNNTPGQSISEGTRKRVLAEAERLGYRPHTAARALASGRTRAVLVVLPDWPLEFSLRSNLEEASRALDEAGYSLVTCHPHPTDRSRPLWEALKPDVVLSLIGSFTGEQIASLRAAGVEALVPDPDDPNTEIHTEEGPKLQLRHLHALGHRAIAFAGSTDPRLADLVHLRRGSARETAAELGLDELTVSDVDLSDESAGAAVQDWTSRGITAVAAYNDDVAASVAGAAARRGFAIPDDLAIIGHDDAPIAAIFHPRLSTIRIDAAGFGRHLARVAISAAEGTPRPQAAPSPHITLIPRESTHGP